MEAEYAAATIRYSSFLSVPLIGVKQTPVVDFTPAQLESVALEKSIGRREGGGGQPRDGAKEAVHQPQDDLGATSRQPRGRSLKIRQQPIGVGRGGARE